MHVDDLRQDLRAAAEGEPAADPIAGRAAVARRHRRHQAVRGAVAAVAVLIVAVAGWQLGSLGGDDDRSLDVGGTAEGPPRLLLLPAPTAGAAPSAMEVSVGDVPLDEGATLTAWAGSDGPERTVLVAAVAGREGVDGPTEWSPDDPVPGWETRTSGREGGWAVTVFTRGLSVEERSRLDEMTLDGAGTATWPVPEDLEPVVAGRRITTAAPMLVLPADGTPGVLVALIGDGDLEATLMLRGGDPSLVDLAVALAEPGTLAVTVRGEPAWVVAGGPFDPGNGGGPTLVWEEGGRGWALSLTSLSGAGVDQGAADQLVAAAATLEPATPERWAEALDRSTALVEGRRDAASGATCAEISPQAGQAPVTVPCDPGSGNFEGQGTPIDPETGEPLTGDQAPTTVTTAPGP